MGTEDLARDLILARQQTSEAVGGVNDDGLAGANGGDRRGVRAKDVMVWSRLADQPRPRHRDRGYACAHERRQGTGRGVGNGEAVNGHRVPP
jgi:hypothetical protein